MGILAALTALLLGALFIGNGLYKTGGDPILPLDDPYTFFTYARNGAYGNLFQYNAEDPPGLGFTSLLYYILCILGYAAGFHGTGMVWFGHLAGAACLGSGIFLAALFYRKRGLPWPLLAALATFGFGKVVWGHFSGMEIGLFTLFVFAAACCYVEERHGPFLYLMLLAGLTRPEGMILLFGATLLRIGHHAKERAGKRMARVAIPFVLGWVFYSSAFLYTGSMFNTAIQKSPFFSSDSGFGLYLFRSNENYGNLLRFLWGYGLGFGSITTLMILGILRLKGREWIFAAIFWAGFFIEGFLAFGMWHHQRYLIPYIPCGAAMLVLGLERSLRGRGGVLWTARLTFLAFIVWSALYWADLFGDNCRDMAWSNGRHLKFAREYLDPEGILLVSDAGLLKYYTNQYTLDFFGLGASSLAVPNAMGGQGCVYEEIRHILADELPPHLRGKPVYVFAYQGFGGQAMEPASFLEPGTFLRRARPGDVVLMAGYDSGESDLDPEMMQALRDLGLEWAEMTENPRLERYIAGYAVPGDDAMTTVTAAEKGPLLLDVPPEVSGGKALRLSVHDTMETPQPYVEGHADFLGRPVRPFQFVIWDPAHGRIRHTLNYSDIEEGRGVGEIPIAWVPYYGFFGYRHQLGADQINGYILQPDFYNGSMNPAAPGSLADLSWDDRLSSRCLNVADMRDEARYDFRFSSMSNERPCISIVERREEPDGGFLIDGGRRITGTFEATVTALPDRPLHVLGRFGNEWPLRLRVFVNDRELPAPWFLTAGDHKTWQYQLLTVPEEYVSIRSRLRFEVLPVAHPHVTVYYLWFLQPAAPPSPSYAPEKR